MNIAFMGFYTSVHLFLSLSGQNLKLEVLDHMVSDCLSFTESCVESMQSPSDLLM